MKKVYALLMPLLFMCCATINVKEFARYNIDNSTKLAREQSELLRAYLNKEPILEKEIQNLEKNVWVKAAQEMAPSNLVIRQLCLIDLFRNSPKHDKEIRNLILCLSYDGKIWSEGYSYWLFTRQVLDVWRVRFDVEQIRELITSIDQGFMDTAYLRGKVWYPAPYGDVSNIPLSTPLQYISNLTKEKPKSTSVANIKLDISDTTIVYYVHALPIGMNVHIPKRDYAVEIVNGTPFGFIFYTGIHNKYSTEMSKWKDLMDYSRINSIRRCK